MKNISAQPQFANLSDDEIENLLDLADSPDIDETTFTEANKVIAELSRLIEAYSERFDKIVDEQGNIPDYVINFEPKLPIERAAYNFFLDALHDAMQNMDESE